MAAPTPLSDGPPRHLDDFPADGSGALASMYTRIGARLFDMLVLMVPAFAVTMPFIEFDGLEIESLTPDLPLWAVIVLAFIPVVYDTLCVAIAGRTAGKAIVGIRVVRYVDGGRVGITHALLRAIAPTLGAILAIGFPLGGLLSFWEPIVYGTTFIDPIRRGLHDKAAGTVVIVA